MKPTHFALVLIGMIMGFLLLIGQASASTNVYNDEGQLMMIVPDYMRDCQMIKYGERAFYSGTEEQFESFLTYRPDVKNWTYRGKCWTTDSYTYHVEGIVPEVRIYQSNNEAMKKFIAEENEKLFKTKQKENKIASLLYELEKVMGRSVTIF